VGWAVGGAPTAWSLPEQQAFMVDGGASATPEFLAVLVGLVMYTAAFVAEVVRGGIQSVSRGQTEAASALGLSRAHQMRLVVLPQALRVIIPPLTNQYLNLTKNSSLAVAIGYPDVVSIANTTLNQSGRAVECIAIIMLVYLTTSLATSLLMNWYNKRVAIKER
ncbi:MAG: ABC transporter permease subunit, partial [Rubrivivax sp.]|nr:ABC transporter permease subunit [Rubrivivax sp.]